MVRLFIFPTSVTEDVNVISYVDHMTLYHVSVLSQHLQVQSNVSHLVLYGSMRDCKETKKKTKHSTHAGLYWMNCKTRWKWAQTVDMYVHCQVFEAVVTCEAQLFTNEII